MFTVYVLVLIGAVIWGINITLRKHFLEHLKMDPWTIIVGSMLSAGIVAFVWQFIRYGTSAITDNGFWIPFAIAACLSIVIQSANVLSLTEDASLVGAIQGLTPVLIILSGWATLKEVPTLFGLIGILSVVAGLYLFRWKKRETETPRLLKKLPEGRMRNAISICFDGNPWRRLFSSTGARIALLSAISGAIAISYGKSAVEHSNPAIQAGTQFLTVSLAVFIFARATGRWKGVCRHFFIACAIGVSVGIAEILFNSSYLFPFGLVAYVGTIKRFQIIVTAVLATVFLKEKFGPTKILAATIIFAGIVLIAF
ncbi:MAG: DMT family transporter [Candidatus Wildermuthbacteria bacterium]|nr:DMT family transporter [Candidatus Wildermuthbacteria bacterium]